MPKKIFSDNGEEFIGDPFIEMCERFDIMVQNSASFSLWNNGVYERHNQTLTNIWVKVKDNAKCNYDTAYTWDTCAKMH